MLIRRRRAASIEALRASDFAPRELLVSRGHRRRHVRERNPAFAETIHADAGLMTPMLRTQAA
jgi:hypothetical protein